MWIPVNSCKFAVAIYNWKGNVNNGLPLEIGDTVQILEENGGWYRGFCTKNRQTWGIFPHCVVSVRPCTVKGTGITAIAEPKDDPLVREIACVLREWVPIWKKIYVEREIYRFSAVAKVMQELLNGRRALLAGNLTQDQTRALRLSLVSKLDWGNKKLHLVLVPRRGAEAVEPEEISIVDLYKVHVDSAENAKNRTAAWQGTLNRSSSTRSSFSSNTLPNSTKPVNNGVQCYHLLCTMCDFGQLAGGDDAELYLWIHDAARQQPLTERFRVRITKEGFTNYVDGMSCNSTVFAELSKWEISSELWLVGAAVRVGRWAGGAERRGPLVRRPLGVAVLKLADLASATHQQYDKKHTFKVYQGEEKDFHQLHDMLIRKQTNKLNVLPGQSNDGISVSVRVLSNASSLEKAVSSGAVVTVKRGFPDVIMPDDVRNDLYFTLERAEFERGGRTTAKNVQASVTVHDDKGQLMEDCVWGCSSAGTSSYESLVLYHNNSPMWGEHLKLTVLDTCTDAHARIEFRHCSSRDKNEHKLFGFSFVKLMEPSGAILRDGAHELYVYKCENPSKLKTASYLSLPSCATDVSYMNNVNGATPPFQRSSKEVCVINTLLCSTKFTQNEDLKALLQWRSLSDDRVRETLLRLGDEISCEELVKSLKDVLDALFDIFATEMGNSTSNSGPVFLLLVSICSLLNESRFQHFRPVLDVYIEQKFSATLVYKGLLLSIQRCAEWAASAEEQEPMCKCLRSLGILFRLAIRSRQLFTQQPFGNQYQEYFERDVKAALDALVALAQHPYKKHLEPAQVALLSSWPGVAEEVRRAVDVGQVARLSRDIVGFPGPPELALRRLHAARGLINTTLARHPDCTKESRNIIVTLACDLIRLHLSRERRENEKLGLVADTVCDLVTLLWTRPTEPDSPQGHPDEFDPDVDVVCLSILPVLVDTVKYLIDNKLPVLGSMVAGLLGVMELLKPAHYQRLWSHLTPHPHDRKPLKDFLLMAFSVFRNIIKKDVFPNNWMVLRVATCKVFLLALQDLAKPLLERFLGDEPPQLDKELWIEYLELGVSVVRCGALRCDRALWGGAAADRHGIRADVGLQLLAVWTRLGPAQIHLVPDAVGVLLQITLVSELRRAALGALVSLMAAERAATGSARRTEAALVDKLDSLVAENKVDDHYRRLFDTVLMERVSSEGWCSEGAAFVACVTRLLERLLDHQAVMQGHEHKDKKMAVTVNLLNFYKNEIDRKEMYLRYLYELHELHIASDNFIEAGCTLLLFATTLSWSSDAVGADTKKPEYRESDRKEALYNQVLQHFDQGKCWEKGLPLLKELATFYETKCNYTELAKCLRKHATFLDSILTQPIPRPNYFRVGYYGKGCPLFVRNKQFIYRGNDYELLSGFTPRMQAQYPSAHILTTNTPPDDSIINSDTQYIQICNVKPVSSRRNWVSGASEQVQQYYECNDVDTFVWDRPFNKLPRDEKNEFKNRWIERTTFVTENPLPDILRWSEVISKDVKEITPVEAACETIELRTRELSIMISQLTHAADKSPDIKDFTMKLSGTIQAPVQGGIDKYKEAFLSPEFAEEASPHELAAAERLRRLITSQFEVLEKALPVHERLATGKVKELHDELVKKFNQSKKSFGFGHRRQESESIVRNPLPPVPIHHTEDYECVNVYESPYGRKTQCVPGSCGEDMTRSVPPLPARPKSGDVRTPTANTLERYRESTGSDLSDRRSMRTSWSESEAPPPLPPRLPTTGAKRSLYDIPPLVLRRSQRIERETSSDSYRSTDSYRYSNSLVDEHMCNNDHNDLYLTPDTTGYEDMILVGENLMMDGGGTPPPIPPKEAAFNSFDSAHLENGDSTC